jgi:hypothetical protein
MSPFCLLFDQSLTNSAVQTDPVVKHITKFNRTSSKPYLVITPLTPLADLAAFLTSNEFALGQFSSILH